jgi:hypothetical protein
VLRKDRRHDHPQEVLWKDRCHDHPQEVLVPLLRLLLDLLRSQMDPEDSISDFPLPYPASPIIQ